MAIEAMKNTSIVYQQGSISGAETGKAQTAAVKPEKIEVSVPERKHAADPRSSKVVEADFQGKTSIGNEREKVELPQGNEALRKAVEEINKNAKNSEAVFGFHEKTNRVTIKIVDKDSKEVLKEFPPEKTLDMIAKVWEMAGLMVDQKL